jgi:hypothetical protein
VQVTFSRIWGADLAGSDNLEGELFGIGEGRCEGVRISGRFVGANHPRRRSDGAFLPNFQGLIETDDGVEILFELQRLWSSLPCRSVANSGERDSPER